MNFIFTFLRNIINKALFPVLKVFRLNKFVFRIVDWIKNPNKAKKYADQIKCISNNHEKKNYNYPLFMCQRNEKHRLPFFLNYYREIGVDHFFVIDNDSDDGSIEFLKAQPDISLWHTKDSYKESNYGMFWCNHLLNTFGDGKWCITCDPDEFLVYPNIETRDLADLTQWMSSMNQPSLFCLMVDCYSDKSIDQTFLDEEGNVFEACPYFDRFNYTQRYSSETDGVWVQGGVRMRKHFKFNPGKAPAQNKVPLIKWQKGYEYLSSMHHTNQPFLNCSVKKDNRYASGAIFHFKYISHFKTKVEEEMQRKQHYAGSVEYKKYNEEGYETLYDENWSEKFTDSKQLIDLKFIHEGEWF